MSLWAAALLAPCAMAQALSTAEAADAGAGSDAGASFPIHGQSVRHASPAGWKLAWMAGDRDGNGHAIAKYIPADEDITHWRRGYRVITRLIAPARIQAWMKALTATTLCGAQQQPACRGAGR